MYLYIYNIYIFNVVLFRQQRMSENIALCFEFKYYALFIGFGFIFVCLIDKKTVDFTFLSKREILTFHFLQELQQMAPKQVKSLYKRGKS